MEDAGGEGRSRSSRARAGYAWCGARSTRRPRDIKRRGGVSGSGGAATPRPHELRRRYRNTPAHRGAARARDSILVYKPGLTRSSGPGHRRFCRSPIRHRPAACCLSTRGVPLSIGDWACARCGGDPARLHRYPLPAMASPCRTTRGWRTGHDRRCGGLWCIRSRATSIRSGTSGLRRARLEPQWHGDYYERWVSDHLSTAPVWYRLLDADCDSRGRRTDAMANYASLRGPSG